MHGHQETPSERHRVLVVDDDRLILDAARDFLSVYEFEVDTASEREEAEALLTTKPYSLLIADLRLTGVHGREGLELVRVARERCPLARIIVITAFSTPELELEVLRNGSNMLLEKPLPLPELLMVARRLLSSGPPRTRGTCR